METVGMYIGERNIGDIDDLLYVSGDVREEYVYIHTFRSSLAQGAARGGHKDLLYAMLDKVVFDDLITYGHNDIVEDMILGRGRRVMGMMSAILRTHGRREILDRMIDKGYSDWNMIAICALYEHRNDIVMEMLERGADNWKEIGQAAFNISNDDIMGEMLKRGVDIDMSELNDDDWY